MEDPLMSRSLASIQRVIDIQPVPNSDKLSVATILGWKVVVGRDEYKPGDLVTYIEIDSILPDWPEFLEVKKRSARIKTIRLRGQISQGICFPLSILNGRKYPNDNRSDPTYDLVESKDVTELLGITKWEPEIPACLGGEVAGPFPSFIPKTDETRIQSVPGVLDRHRGKLFYATEKLDGSSCTIYYRDGHIGVCGRNFEFKETTDNAYRKAAISTGAIDLLTKLKRNVALQGELLGPGVNGSRKYGLREPTIRYFNVYDIDKARHMGLLDARALAGVLPWVFVLPGWITLDHTVDQLIELSKRDNSLFKDKDGKALKNEGLVFRPCEESYDEELGRLSFKAINPEYLLKEDA
jgi:RNA ligase (TIGR02306 family)